MRDRQDRVGLSVMRRALAMCLFAMLAAWGAVANAQSTQAGALAIEQRLKGVPSRWDFQTVKALKESDFEVWLTATDEAIRYSSSQLCKKHTTYVYQDVLATGIYRAGRSGVKRPYAFFVAAPFYASDVVWVDPLVATYLKVDDILLSYTREDFKAKPIGQRYSGDRNQYKSNIYPTRTIITGDAGVDAMIQAQPAGQANMLLYKNGQFDFFTPAKAEKASATPAIRCNGSVSTIGSSLLGNGGLTKAFTNAIGDKEYFKEPHYLQGGEIATNSYVSYYDSVVRIFTRQELQWMLVDHFATDVAFVYFQNGQYGQFSDAYKKFISKVAFREGILPEKAAGVARVWFREPTLFLSIYVGANAGWPIEQYADFLDSRERYLHGKVDPDLQKIRRALIKYWQDDMTAHTLKPGRVAPDVDRVITAMGNF